MENQTFLIALVGVLLSALLGGYAVLIGLLIVKAFDLQRKIGNLHSGNPSKLNLHSLIITVYLFSLVILILWISVLIWWFSSQIGPLHPLSIILYAVTVVTFASLILIFYENLRSSVLSACPRLLSPIGATLLWALTLLGYTALLYVSRRTPYSYVGSSFIFHILLLVPALFALPQTRSHVTVQHIITAMKKGLTSVTLIVAACTVVPVAFLRYFFATPVSPSILTPVTSFSTLLYIPLLIVIGPVAEELFFRGYLQTRLQKTLLGALGGVFVASIFYALIHIPKILWAQQYIVSFSFVSNFRFIALGIQPILSMFLLSVIFGLIYLETKSLIYPIIFHSGWNIIVLAMMLLRV